MLRGAGALGATPPSAAGRHFEDPRPEELIRLEHEAVALIVSGRFEAGMNHLKMALDLDRDDPRLNLNYASALFRYGSSAFQAGYERLGREILAESELYLRRAGDLYEDDGLSRGHVFYLLGEIRRHVHGDVPQAAEWYRQALAADPEHLPAAEALRQLEAEL